MYNVIDLSAYIINRTLDQGYTITALKLQRILYFMQAYFLINLNKPAFSDEIEAWDSGPTIKAVWEKHWVYNYACLFRQNEPTIDFESSDEQKLIDHVINKCMPYGSHTLLSMLNCEGSPWASSRNSITIPVAKIKSYYETLK